MRIFVDMDNVLVDFPTGIDRLEPEDKARYEGNYDDAPGIFRLMDPVDGAIKGYEKLCEDHDVFILSTAPWGNPTAWSDKLLWVKKHLGECAEKRLILTHHKYLVRGDVLIDDRRKRGAGAFSGRHLHFGEHGEFKDWDSVLAEIEAIS
ncbi:MAG: hypothetical protein CMH55_09745 [Myxococcales bacterium]|nr:hypothetical protein [Myxococcales bacterium]|tara:strand:+ start:222 stop:668 length:447 start_codon:yes stop_codon:yes gene_type:complete